MSRNAYPVLIWELPSGASLGQAIGLDLELVQADPRKLAAALSAHLRREAEQGRLPAPPIADPVMKRFRIEVRASYRGGKIVPAPTVTVVPVTAIYGRTPWGSTECHLPLLGLTFEVFEPRTLPELVKHFAVDALSGLPPEELNRYLFAPPPVLETVFVDDAGPDAASRAREPAPAPTAHLEKHARRHSPGGRRAGNARQVVQAAWERDSLIARAREVLTVPRANLLLVGEPGVGKSAILDKALHQVLQAATRRDPGSEGARPPTVWRTTPHLLIAGARYLGEWQEACERLVEELEGVGGILWIDEFMNLFAVGGEGPEDSLGAYLTPFLAQGRFRVVGELDPRELDRARTLAPGFLDLFRVLPVEEMDRGTVRRVFERFREAMVRDRGLALGQKALETAYRLLHRHLRAERFPGKAIRFLSGVVREAGHRKRTGIEEAHIIDAFAEKTGLAPLFLRDDLPLDEAHLRGFFDARIIGQEACVDRICDVVRMFKAGLNDPGRPIAVLLLAGPTGVGKTATVRALASYLFGAGLKVDPLIRLDMSEYQHPGQVERLIGGAGGEAGPLARDLRARPFAVLLLDEIEKAHPAMFDVLLTMLDEGRLTDALGRQTDLRNCIIAMTTNVGARSRVAIGFGTGAATGSGSGSGAAPAGAGPGPQGGSAGDTAGGTPGRSDGADRAAIRAFFRPEFCNRIDQVLSFRPLGEADTRRIARKELAEVAGREGIVKRGLAVEFTEAVVELVSREGFDPRYGARPLQRAIERLVTAPLARFLVANPALAGGQLRVDVSGSALVILPGDRRKPRPE